MNTLMVSRCQNQCVYWTLDQGSAAVTQRIGDRLPRHDPGRLAATAASVMIWRQVDAGCGTLTAVPIGAARVGPTEFRP